MPAHLDIVLQRNEDWARSIFVTDGDQPINLGSMTVAMQVRDRLGQALVTQAAVYVVDAPGGEISALLKASEGTSLASYGDPIQPAELLYDLRLSDSDGFNIVLFAGRVILTRGETRA